MHNGELAALLEGFFKKRLISQRRVSPHTIASYRDTFRLLLSFAQQRLKLAPLNDPGMREGQSGSNISLVYHAG